jgi:hypothetical protein
MLPDVAGFMSSLLLLHILLTIRRGDYLFIYYLLIYFSFYLLLKEENEKQKQNQAKAKIEPARTENTVIFYYDFADDTIRCEFFFS